MLGDLLELIRKRRITKESFGFVNKIHKILALIYLVAEEFSKL